MRTRGRGIRAEEGSAIVEFIFIGVLLLVPLIYLTMMVARVQAGSYAATQAAREAGRAFVTAESDESAGARAHAAAQIAFADQGFAGDEGELGISCSASPCLTPQGRIDVSTRVTVPLPFIPSFARDVVPLEVPVSATHVLIVDRFRGQ